MAPSTPGWPGPAHPYQGTNSDEDEDALTSRAQRLLDRDPNFGLHRNTNASPRFATPNPRSFASPATSYSNARPAGTYASPGTSYNSYSSARLQGTYESPSTSFSSARPQGSYSSPSTSYSSARLPGAYASPSLASSHAGPSGTYVRPGQPNNNQNLPVAHGPPKRPAMAADFDDGFPPISGLLGRAGPTMNANLHTSSSAPRPSDRPRRPKMPAYIDSGFPPISGLRNMHSLDSSSSDIDDDEGVTMTFWNPEKAVAYDTRNVDRPYPNTSRENIGLGVEMDTSPREPRYFPSSRELNDNPFITKGYVSQGPRSSVLQVGGLADNEIELEILQPARKRKVESGEIPMANFQGFSTSTEASDEIPAFEPTLTTHVTYQAPMEYARQASSQPMDVGSTLLRDLAGLGEIGAATTEAAKAYLATTQVSKYIAVFFALDPPLFKDIAKVKDFVIIFTDKTVKKTFFSAIDKGAIVVASDATCRKLEEMSARLSVVAQSMARISNSDKRRLLQVKYLDILGELHYVLERLICRFEGYLRHRLNNWDIVLDELRTVRLFLKKETGVLMPGQIQPDEETKKIAHELSGVGAFTPKQHRDVLANQEWGTNAAVIAAPAIAAHPAGKDRAANVPNAYIRVPKRAVSVLHAHRNGGCICGIYGCKITLPDNEHLDPF